MKKTESLTIEGMHCASCSMLITKALVKSNGVINANVNYSLAKGTIEYDDTKINTEELIKIIKSKGYSAYIGDNAQNIKLRYEKETKGFKRLFLISLIFSIPAFILGMFFMEEGLLFLNYQIPHIKFILWILATPVQFYVGYSFYKGTWVALKNKSANMDSLIAIGTSVAYFYSVYSILIDPSQGQYFEVSAILITLVVMGKFLEAKAKSKTSDAIEKLIKISPKTAIIIRDKKEIEVEVDQVSVGDIIIVKPGEKVPVDGIVIEGESSVDESMISGESMPVEKRKNSLVIGGTINKHGVLYFKATKVGKDTTLSHIIKLIEDAQGRKAPIQRFADVISSYFVPTVIIISIITFISWYFLFKKPLSFSLITAVSVIVIACPCALGLATPTAIMVGTGKGARNGILIKGGDVLETTHKIKSIIFDKTGTITKGKPEVTDIIPMNIEAKNILSIAASIEKQSEHSLADAIVSYSKIKKTKIKKVTKFKAVPGHGVVANIGIKTYYLGNFKLMDLNKIKLTNNTKNKINLMEGQGKTVMILADKQVLGLISVADNEKETSKEAIKKLHDLNIQVYMITGDNKKTAEAIAQKVGIKNVFAEVLPEDKVNYVKKLQVDGRVAMIGDGINDAPAIAQADVGIAMGSGTDVVMETGDIVLIRNDLLDVFKAIKLSKVTMIKIKQNMFWALIYNIIGIPIAAGVFYSLTGWLLSPIIAGGAMALSSVSVVTNSLLLKYKKIN